MNISRERVGAGYNLAGAGLNSPVQTSTVQHRLSTLLGEACCLVDRIQLHAEKREPLHWHEFALFPVDPKTQLAEVPEHQVPVCAQLLARLCKYEPVVKVVEDAHTPFSQGNKGRLRDFGEDARRQGQPEGQDLVLICPTLKHESQEWPVSREDRDMKVCVLQVDRCKPI